MSQTRENTLNPITAGLQGIGLILLIILSYLGLNYIWEGSAVMPAVVSVLLAILIFFAVFGLVKLKNLKQNKGIRPAEIMLWVGYAVLAVASFFPLAHFANVDISAKRSIQADAKSRLGELDAMTADYKQAVASRVALVREDILAIASKVGTSKSVDVQKSAAAEAAKYGIPEKIDARNQPAVIKYYEDNADRIAASYEKAAFEDSNPQIGDLADRENRIEAFTLEYGKVVDDWNRGRLYEALNAIDGEVKDYKIYLGDLYADIDPDDGSYWDDETYTYEEQTSSIDNVINSFGEVREKYPDQVGLAVPIGILLLVHFFIISPYLFLQRLGNRRYYNRPDVRETGGGGGIEI